MASPRVLLAVLVCAASAGTSLGFAAFSVGLRPPGLIRSVASSGPRVSLGRGRGPAGAPGLRAELLSNFKTAVKELQLVEEFHDLITRRHLVILKLGSSHCRKCFAVQPKFAQVAEQFQGEDDVEFAMVHLDKVRGMVQETGVKKTPTFHVYKDGEKVDELVGSGDVSSVIVKVRGLVEQWRAEVAQGQAAGAHDMMVQQIVNSYTPEGEEASPLSDSSSPSSSDSDSEGDTDEQALGECNEDECEISFD